MSEESGFGGWFYNILCHLVQMYTSEPPLPQLKKEDEEHLWISVTLLYVVRTQKMVALQNISAP